MGECVSLCDLEAIVAPSIFNVIRRRSSLGEDVANFGFDL
jgi:hypothetical protein